MGKGLLEPRRTALDVLVSRAVLPSRRLGAMDSPTRNWELLLV
jgi:hypothetical protein